MKLATRSLKQRIGRAFLLLAFVLAGFFTLTAYLSVEVIEEQVLDARLRKTAEILIEQHRQGQRVETPLEISFFVDDQIPAQLRQLAPGLRELSLDGRNVLVLTQADGAHRFAVVEEVEEFEHTETVIFLSLAAGFVSSLLLAAILGRATAKRMVAPISALAAAVSANAKPAELPSLEAQDEIGVLARAFAKRAEELQHFLVRERLFTGDVNHELRTPLTVILGAADVLKAQLAERPEQLAAAERIRRVAADSAQRVAALLLLSRGPEQLDAPRTALHPLIRSELDRCQHLLVGKPVQCRLDCDGEAWAAVRPELAGIVIGNLLRNACLHTDAGTIAVHLAPGRLVISDDGPGLPASVRARLFERFVQGSDSPEGTGLGLSIVGRVVEHIGWGIEVECPAAGGTRFVLSFPRAS